MSFFTQPAVQGLRRQARKLGLTRPIAILLGRGGYEARFDEAMAAALPQALVIWDVGANQGIYTAKFVEATRGKDGAAVFAFEPSPRSQAVLNEKFGDDPLVTLCQMALSDSSGTSYFQLGDSEDGVTDSMTIDATGIEVRVATVDEMVSSGAAQAPDLMKIDVEGFEYDVLRGMSGLIASLPPRHIFMEIHFTQLDARGQTNAARDMENMLKQVGYTVRWVDNSHIHAHHLG